jgi:hypothetical protein
MIIKLFIYTQPNERLANFAAYASSVTSDIFHFHTHLFEMKLF